MSGFSPAAKASDALPFPKKRELKVEPLWGKFHKRHDALPFPKKRELKGALTRHGPDLGS